MAKARPDKDTDTGYSIIGLLALVAYFAVDYFVESKPDIFYGHFGPLLLGAITAVIAKIKNRNPIAWFAAGAWFVIAALIVVLIVSRLHDRLCPFCAEGISEQALTCPHCRKDLAIQA